jgi:hypothetical protein
LNKKVELLKNETKYIANLYKEKHNANKRVRIREVKKKGEQSVV